MEADSVIVVHHLNNSRSQRVLWLPEAAASCGGLDARRPKLMAFLERIHARPEYNRALQRGGPYELLR